MNTEHQSTQHRKVGLPADWWEEIETRAAAGGIPVAEWIRQACLARLPESTRHQLSPPRRRGRPQLGS